MGTRITSVNAARTPDDNDYASRWWAETDQLHHYLKAELADPSIQWLIPRCGEGLYPARHARVEISRTTTRTSGRYATCEECRAESRRSRRSDLVTRPPPPPVDYDLDGDGCFRDPGGLVDDVRRANEQTERSTP